MIIRLLTTATALTLWNTLALAQAPAPPPKQAPRPAPILSPYGDNASCRERCNAAFAACGNGKSEFERCWNERDACRDICTELRRGTRPLIAPGQ